jgi:hypothetical protein
MRPLRRVPVELFAGQSSESRANEYFVSFRGGGIALGGELEIGAHVFAWRG